jgi:hypothetical protein
VWYWREQFLNWLTFCDGRFLDLIKDVEQLGSMTKMSTLETPVRELATKLYSILSSYCKDLRYKLFELMVINEIALQYGID